MKLYVGNLTPQVTEAELTELMTPFGKPTTLSIVRDKASGQSRGFAFVEFANASEANAALTALNGKEVGGQALRVNEARDSKSKGPRA